MKTNWTRCTKCGWHQKTNSRKKVVCHKCNSSYNYNPMYPETKIPMGFLTYRLLEKI
ncbi:MAG: hypothetical protein PHW96_02455 [Candidatus Nanoarchaeia archaeon]|nr:hypothetical protein [Candidatus Nanoarchaeia archaeon]